jgi:glycerophosphoryl diester phosphodiesterase
MTPWAYPKLFAHRGGGRLAPENTLAAMKAGERAGFRAVEFDAKLSADGVVMLMHDDTLERTTSGRGAFATYAHEDLERLDAGTWFNASFANEPIPRMSSVMRFLHANGMNANIEIKPCPGREVETGERVAAIAKEITRQQLAKPLLSSFSVDALRAAARSAPSLPCALLVEYYTPLCDPVLEELRCVSLHCAHQSVSADMLKHLHQKKLRVLTYTVNDVETATRLFRLGVDGIFTDALPEMAAKFPQALTA